METSQSMNQEQPMHSPVSPAPVDDTARPRLSLRPLYTTLILLLGVLMGVGGLFAYQEFVAAPSVFSYDECVRARGSTLQESYPATCITRNGTRFTQPTIDDGVNPIHTDPASCNSDSDCAIAIMPGGCCACPSAINKTAIGKEGWERYISGKDYSKQSTCETFMACKPCDTPTKPVCRDNQCVFDNGTPAVPPKNTYTCPKSEWVDCMPGPNQGIKFECTNEFLTWAEANCPDFKGAAL